MAEMEVIPGPGLIGLCVIVARFIREPSISSGTDSARRSIHQRNELAFMAERGVFVSKEPISRRVFDPRVRPLALLLTSLGIAGIIFIHEILST